MGFRVKKKGAEDEGGKTEKAPPLDSEEETHGGEQDSEEEAKHAAGKDMLDAIESGDPKAVYEAHRHLHHVHMTTSAEGGGDDADSPDVTKKSSFVDAIRRMPLKIGA